MKLRNTIASILGGSVLLGLVACGGGGGGSDTPKTASSLTYTDPTSGEYQLKKNTNLSTANKLVLDLVANNAGNGAGNGAGVAFHLTADTTKVAWAKVADSDAEYVKNGAVFNLGNAPQALKGKVAGNLLQVAVSQKGVADSKPLNGVLASVALSLKTGVTPGTVNLEVVSGKAQGLSSTGDIGAITITKGALAAE